MALWSRGGDCLEGEERLLVQVLDDLTLPILVIDAELNVLDCNAAAQELVARNAGLAIVLGQLRVSGEGHDRLVRLAGLIAGNPAAQPAEYNLQVSGGGRELPLHLCIRGLRGGAGIARGSRMAIYVIDPGHQPPIDAELLRRVYRLSPAEIRVVRELMQGQSVETIAEVLAISIYTVRTHLRNLFAKTGTNRQGELIARIAASLSSLRAPENPSIEGCDSKPLENERASNRPGFGGTPRE
jgi:DNA-binding CsgD family transcriptional regulator